MRKQQNVIATLKGGHGTGAGGDGAAGDAGAGWTGPMRQEAAAGFCVPEHFPDRQFPRVQTATIEELLNGNGPDVPHLGLLEARRSAALRATGARRGGHSRCCRVLGVLRPITQPW